MKVLEMMRGNAEWESVLTAKPYCLKVKRDGGYVILSYNQLESDFYNPIVRECRGLIVDEATLTPVCVPFYKFGNYGEGYVPDIDWATARTQEKVDGSLIKVWYHNGEWRVSTNGTIDAYKCPLGLVDFARMECPYETFGELFDAAKEKAGIDFDRLDKSNTYMFELVSPYNKVVVSYEEIDLYHIGTRNNDTLREMDIDIGVKKPKSYDLKTLDDCVSAAAEMSFNEEGFVVVDKNWNRVKVKSPAYVEVHHLKGNDTLNIKGIVELIKRNETEEFLSYFPEYRSAFNAIEERIAKLILGLENGLSEIQSKEYETQKDFALEVKDRPFASYYFLWRKSAISPREYVYSSEANKIKEWIKE